MLRFFNFPYTSFNQVNLDWMMKTMNELKGAIPLVAQAEETYNRAVSLVHDAVDAINSATAKANQAASSASQAASSANQAASSANQAASSADTAQEQASQANSTAQEAREAASVAASTASIAEQTANQALNLAQSAPPRNWSLVASAGFAIGYATFAPESAGSYLIVVTVADWSAMTFEIPSEWFTTGAPFGVSPRSSDGMVLYITRNTNGGGVQQVGRVRLESDGTTASITFTADSGYSDNGYVMVYHR